MRAKHLSLILISAIALTALIKTTTHRAVSQSHQTSSSASQVTWQAHFGTSRADTQRVYTLMAYGYFRAPTNNVSRVVQTWIKEHPEAVVIPVMTPKSTSSPHLSYIWVTQGNDSLNLELVRQGCFAAETQLLKLEDKPEVSPQEYEAFVQKVTQAGQLAKAEKLGIWQQKAE
jgi:hypothetical protein